MEREEEQDDKVHDWAERFSRERRRVGESSALHPGIPSRTLSSSVDS
jgi:hypothetical protein